MINSALPARSLVAYNKLTQAPAAYWLPSLRALGVLSQARLFVPKPSPPLGDIAFIRTDAGGICYLTNEQAFLLTGVRLRAGSMLLVGSGLVEVMKPEGVRRYAQGDLVLFPDCEAFNLKVSASSQLALLQFDLPLGNPSNSGDLSSASLLVQDFLYQSRFFASHDYAVKASERLLQSIRELVESGGSCEPERITPALDMRVHKALEVMDNSAHWQFKLFELASAAGASERNLYYLMRAETGMTPYGYYQRSRLLKARERMVDCRQRAPSISWLATNEGFAHLGRFSALYKQQFGELPSDTLEWVNTIRRLASHNRDSLAPTKSQAKSYLLNNA